MSSQHPFTIKYTTVPKKEVKPKIEIQNSEQVSSLDLWAWYIKKLNILSMYISLCRLNISQPEQPFQPQFEAMITCP
jgi:hypothetical protein